MQTSTLAYRKRWPLSRTFALLTSIAVVTSALVVAIAWAKPGLSPEMTGPLRIGTVTYSPQAPNPGEHVTVTARIAGVRAAGQMTVSLQYAAYFGPYPDGRTDTEQMEYVGDRAYRATLRGFPDGTEAWFVVALTQMNGEPPIISESYTVDFGNVPRDGASGLKITGVQHTPENPWANDPITIEATVTSHSPIVDVNAAYFVFCPQRPIGIDPDMVPALGSVYRIEIGTPADQCGFQSAVLVYRVLAVDATGNTAVSEAVVVAIEGPDWGMPVPFR